MNFETLQKRRYVKEYDPEADIPKSLIDSLLLKAWKVTPSKNNFMPYTVHVVGPEHKDIKEKVFLNCLSNEGRVDKIVNPLEERYKEYLPNYANILNCSYLFIFTMRLETDPNPFQKYLIEKGYRFEAVDQSRLNDLDTVASLEVGLFTDALSSFCLECDIDVSFTGCFHRTLDHWKDIPFITQKPIILMTAGKGKVYLDEIKTGLQKKDLRPNFNRIVNFVK